MSNLLLIGHSDAQSTSNFGGTEYLFSLLSDSNLLMEIVTMCPTRRGDHMEWVVRRGQKTIGIFSEPCSIDGFTTGSVNFVNWFSETLLDLDISLVHVFHHLNNPITIIPMAKRLGIKTILTLHDYSQICDSFNLLDENGKYCEVLEKNSAEKCFSCSIARGSTSNKIINLRIAYSEILDVVDLVTCGSNFHRFNIENLFNLPSDKIRVIAPTVPSQSSSSHLRDKDRILILGNFTKPKGADLIIDLLGSNELTDFTFVQAGRIDLEYRAKLEHFSNAHRIELLGQYQLGKIPMSTAGVAFFGSNWPETFCIAASEALELGLKIVVPELGAFIERFEAHPNAFLYEVSNLHSATKALKLAAASEFIEIDSTPDASAFVTGFENEYERLLQTLTKVHSKRKLDNSWLYPVSFLIRLVQLNPLPIRQRMESLLKKFVYVSKRDGVFIAIRKALRIVSSSLR